MRHFKITAVLAVAALAVSAAPALAHEFISTGGTTKARGEEQVFHFGPFHIECAKATATGSAVAGSSQTLFASIRPMKCKTEAKIGENPIFLKTHFRTPLAVEYHANGFVEIGSEGEEVEGNTTLLGGSVELKIHSIKCVLTIPEQTLPKGAIKNPEGEFEAATYTTEPEERGKRKFDKLSIFDEWGHMHYEYGEGQCAGFKISEEERRGGRYEGELLDEVRGGSLAWE
jgi:hypothetical protein